jgi:kynurenine formamidase
MTKHRGSLFVIAFVLAGMLFGLAAGMALGSGEAARGVEVARPLGFSRAVFLSHVNDPAKVPGFPGDPAFRLSTAFTVPDDGYYLQYVKEGEHTGTHYSSPCHFHVGALCADEMAAGDFILPAVVVDVRSQVAADVDYKATVADLKAWEAEHGPFPRQAAVLLRTGCDEFWGPARGGGIPTYYNCGSGERGFHQPGFSRLSVRWLIDHGVLGKRGALGTDTFGPDPGSDPTFFETWLTLRRHRFTLENLTHLGALPTTGAWIVFGGPRNLDGSGAPSTVFGLVP